MTRKGKELLLVTGGCRSGKSRFAQRWAEARAASRLFLATAQAVDEEMAERIRRHKRGRGMGWSTVEEPMEVSRAIREHGHGVGVMLMDCATIWVSNLLVAGLSDEEVLAKAASLREVLQETPCSAAIVTNEVGWGIVPDHPLGRRFRDLAGSVNQILAEAADRLVLMVAGVPVTVKPLSE